MSTLERRDGHTHTQFCRHGSREQTELMVQKAVDLGFQSYSLTEHPPLPEGFEDPAPDKSCGLPPGDLDKYFEHARGLKKRFAGRIEVRAGLEVDFILGFEAATRQLLSAHGPDLEDGLLSVHFMEGNGGWRCVDHSPDDFCEGLLEPYGSLEAVHRAYWSLVKQAILADLGPYKPRRIGHLSLVHKFQKRFPLADRRQFLPEIKEILDLIHARNMELDLDAAGLFKPDCLEVYPAPWIIEAAVQRGIPLVYGSDAHSIQGVGQGFEEAERIMRLAQQVKP